MPADDGPPLGLSWDVQGEHSTSIDDYEDEAAMSGDEYVVVLEDDSRPTAGAAHDSSAISAVALPFS